MKPNTNFLIVGLGLMGGSYALGLSQAGHTVNAVDRDAAALRFALQKGWIQEGETECTPALAARADCVVLALYPAGILPWLRAHGPHLRPGAFVTDVCGVKNPFVHEAQALLPENEFIPCHPMAGREVSGVRHANLAMFRGANFLITPTEHNTPAGVAFARALAETLGFGRVTQLSPRRHDELVAHVSQLTHAIAAALMLAGDDPLLPAVTGDSFRDLTRIADINAPLWAELLLANRGPLAGRIGAFTESLAAIGAALEENNAGALQALLEESARRHRALFGPPG